MTRFRLAALALPLLALAALRRELPAQSSTQAKTGNSPNIKLVGHLLLDGNFANGGVDIESEPSRPYVYVSGMNDDPGFWVVSVADPAKPTVLLHYKFPMAASDKGLAGENGRYFKLKGRYYYAKTVQFNVGSAHDSLGLIVYDVTGLPNPSSVKEVAHIGSIGARVVHVFPYRHSDGRTLLVTTPTVGAYAQIYDAEKLLSSGAEAALLSKVPIPDEVNLKSFTRAYHDTYVQYDPATRQDKLYGAGTGGFHVFDITKPESPRYLLSMSGEAGLVTGRSHTMIVSPDSRYALGTTEQQYWPVYIFDLQAQSEGRGGMGGMGGAGGAASRVLAPVGAWAADWRDMTHIVAVRWPYVFAAAYEDGLQVFSLADPKRPKNEGWYYTCMCEHQTGWSGSVTTPGTTVMNGAGDIDVRNADGLIVMTDYTTGLWIFRMDGFNGWNGRTWRLPNLSKEQDWDRGPVAAVMP
jgi:hypothetical protein